MGQLHPNSATLTGGTPRGTPSISPTPSPQPPPINSNNDLTTLSGLVLADRLTNQTQSDSQTHQPQTQVSNGPITRVGGNNVFVCVYC